ncbi:hypothetical protein TcCL_NonESM10752 [Trypanosoma cruzi]|uniref:Uncharacterized protein n=1 Tax=Trypanosoma cruzi (strain CL Brener) TaxID=353153 RepID=Q4D200_TRYCC|nr:hypothetical protein Tc00.1047053509665.10 [Trypanosoma cruzi]EAN86549.1 hypothetical protein Tc00.1047053509665.10 [Trypanosoma cruzi]RNC39842.1 hypothetical protein TcCL_NonESM10752 [Trypanosoma cruzi]|eukprot:XP_808400.1 hypothetical protein [Trypanosoma cruzi strain CL Brener]
MMAAMVAMVTVRCRAVCAVLVLGLLCCCCSSVCVTAAGSAGHVSGDANAVVVSVDVLCTPSDGSPRYRVRVCVCAWKRCSAASAEAQHGNYTFIGFDVRMHSRDGELCAVRHVVNAVHTSSNCATSCATEEEGATVAFTTNVTTHKYAGPYELWWRQFPPMEPSIRLHGAAMLTRRASVSCRHPVKGRMTQNLVGQLRRKSMLSRHVRTRIGDGLRRLTDPTPSIRVPHPTRRPTHPR